MVYGFVAQDVGGPLRRVRVEIASKVLIQVSRLAGGQVPEFARQFSPRRLVFRPRANLRS
jgi:hypothetical protein